ncbi:hypothetical protein AB672_06400 [Xylella taiwanensis]|nr:hypothetical protein AB672_06335 [Xylella taiwanensis]AXI83589.1 hypothetical protein AB672_06400 [Xylella taiwanensis]
MSRQQLTEHICHLRSAGSFICNHDTYVCLSAIALIADELDHPSVASLAYSIVDDLHDFSDLLTRLSHRLEESLSVAAA